MPIIAFTGKKKSGKSKAAEYLIKNCFTPINFKDALIDEIKDNFPNLLKELSKIYQMDIDKLFEEKPPIMRTLIQNYGTDVRRKDNKDYWVNKWLNKTLKVKNIVVDDCRFLNEAQAVRTYNGKIYRINRRGCGGDKHQSETEMDKIKVDGEIDNNSELKNLYKQLDLLI